MDANVLRVNQDLYCRDKYRKTSVVSVYPAISISGSQYLSQNQLGDISAIKSHNDQILHAPSIQTSSQNQKSPQDIQQHNNLIINLNTKNKESMLNSRQSQLTPSKITSVPISSPSNLQGQTYNRFKGFFISIYTKRFLNIEIQIIGQTIIRYNIRLII